MSATTAKRPKEVMETPIKLFAARFEIEGTAVTPQGSYDIRNPDTSTYRRDTEDYDT
jgi:hypothetical protein